MGVAARSVISCQQENAARYKQLYLNTRGRLQSLRKGNALEETLLFGHTDRVMALHYQDGKLVTGMLICTQDSKQDNAICYDVWSINVKCHLL